MLLALWHKHNSDVPTNPAKTSSRLDLRAGSGVAHGCTLISGEVRSQKFSCMMTRIKAVVWSVMLGISADGMIQSCNDVRGMLTKEHHVRKGTH